MRVSPRGHLSAVRHRHLLNLLWDRAESTAGRIDPEHAAAERYRGELGIGTDDEDLGDESGETGVVDLPGDMIERLRVDLSVWKPTGQ